MLDRKKTCPRDHAYPGTGLVTSSTPTIPRIASHCHRAVLVLCSLSIAFLFLPLMFRPCGTHPHSSIIIHPMILALPPQSLELGFCKGVGDRPSLSRKKCITWEKNSRVAWSSVLGAVDKRTQICNACIRAALRSVGVDLTACVLHPCHT